MKIKLTFVFIILLGLQVFPQVTKITGSWFGKLKVQGFELRLVFNISNEEGTLKATMDSPDQGAKGIPMGEVSFIDNQLVVKSPALRGEYKGTLEDNIIKGTWSQNGQVFDLSLEKQENALNVNRPQEPQPPFNYFVQEVTFKNTNGGHQLSGILTIPKGEGAFPAVILITGSGAQNRDEEIFGHKPFWVIADYLTKNGITVLRYDDQGVGKSGGSQFNTTTYDYSFDAEAAYRFLQNDERINKKQIGFAGHSEGGLIAAIAAERLEEIGFFISLAGPALPGKGIIRLQVEKIMEVQGVPKEIIDKELEWQSAFSEILIQEKNNQKAWEKINKVYSEHKKTDELDQDAIQKEIKQLNQKFPIVTYNWMRFYLKTDPAQFLKHLKCPVLVLNGEKDVQVLAGPNLEAFDEIFKKSGLKDYELHELKGLNHLFQPCKTGLPNEYGSIEVSFSGEVLQLMKDWILKKFSTN